MTRPTQDATTGALRVDPASQQAERCRNGPSQIAIVEDRFGGQSKQIVYNTWLGEFVVRDLESMDGVSRALHGVKDLCFLRSTTPGPFGIVPAFRSVTIDRAEGSDAGLGIAMVRIRARGPA